MSINNWKDQQKNIANELLILIFALWTLIEKGDQSMTQDGQKIYKFPHCAQVLCIMLLLGFDGSEAQLQTGFSNQLTQILTGEGKSVILGALATILALIGNDVDVVCYSQYLSERDYKDFSKLFIVLNITDKIKYSTFTELSNALINREGDIREMSQSLLQGNNIEIKKQKFDNRILLVDEVDVFFSSDFYGQTYNPITRFKTQEIDFIMKEIWRKKLLTPQLIIQDIIKTQQYKDLIQRYPEFSRFFDSHFRQMANAPSQLKTHIYEVQEGEIGYRDHDSISTKTSYGYITTYAYFQECEKGSSGITEQKRDEVIGINLECGHYSYADAPFKYNKILGVTGTLSDLHQESLNIIKQYKIKKSMTPSMFGNSRISFDQGLGVSVEMDKEQYFMKIQSISKLALEDGRPVMIFFRDKDTLYEYYNSKYLPVLNQKDVQIIDQNNQNIPYAVEKATRKSQLSLCDRSFGRGTDFKYVNSKIDQKGGILVIQTFFSKDMSEQTQHKGRTARQSKPGEYKLILLADHIQEDFHIQKNVILEKTKSMQTIYQFLDSQRYAIWGKELNLLNESIKNANIKHKNTEEYMQLLIQNKSVEAKKKLIQFNIKNQGECSSYYHFIFCLDDSGSMGSCDLGNKSRWENLMTAFQAFINERESATKGLSQDIISVIYHAHDSRIVAQYNQLSQISQTISCAQPCYGENSFYKATNSVIDLIQNEPQENKGIKKIILFLSDGGDCDSKQLLKSSMQNILKQFKEQITYWWCMGFGPGAEQGLLKEMSNWMKECGGQYKSALNASELQEMFEKISVPEKMDL